jgi:hypothetical protein
MTAQFKGILYGITRDPLTGKVTRTRAIWAAMRRRCAGRGKGAHCYAGRGIEVCEKWRSSFLAFLTEMGEAPNGFTLDRINNDLGYCKENCRWATRLEQSWNSRRTKLITYDGKTQSHRAWAREIGMGQGMFSRNISKGLTIEQIIATPRRRRP